MLKLDPGGRLHLTVRSPIIARCIVRLLPLESLWRSGYLYTIHTAESVAYLTVKLPKIPLLSMDTVILTLSSELTPAQKLFFGPTNFVTLRRQW